MDTTAHFSHSYAEAREKFHAAAGARGARVYREVHPSERGAQGEELSMDFARLGGEQAAGALLLTSATHGVEGFCGSGCQVALLHDEVFLAEAERAGIVVLMVHAVNPYGFSHLRRANEDNVDLNRNFQDFHAPLPENKAYAELHRYLLPAAWPPAADNEAHLDAWQAKHGAKAYQAAISGGQFHFADGLFYAGARASWSNAALRALLRSEAAQRQRLGWIDFHTGLGPRGHGEKIYAGRDDRVEVARARAWWGGEVTSYFDGSSTSARVSGVICGAAYDECPRAEITAMALEYGTYPLEETLQALRAEHWLHNHPNAPEAQRVEIKQHMRDIFYIDDDDWKARVYAQTRAACLRAVTQLAAAPVRA
jgi:predicted deacylase